MDRVSSIRLLAAVRKQAKHDEIIWRRRMKEAKKWGYNISQKSPWRIWKRSFCRQVLAAWLNAIELERLERIDNDQRFFSFLMSNDWREDGF